MKTLRRKRKLKLDPKLAERLSKRIWRLDPKLAEKLSERICLSGPPPKPKVTPQFRARFLAYAASHDLRSFAGTIQNAAFHRDKLFFHYLDKYLKKKPIRLPISEEQRKLLQLYFQKPHLSASDALKELCLQWSKGDYRAAKKRALERSELMTHVWRKGWLE